MEFLTNILMNFDFSVDFSLTYYLLTVASFRIRVPSILFDVVEPKGISRMKFEIFTLIFFSYSKKTPLKLVNKCKAVLCWTNCFRDISCFSLLFFLQNFVWVKSWSESIFQTCIMWNPTIFNIIPWVDRLIDQASDGPSIILIDWK